MPRKNDWDDWEDPEFIDWGDARAEDDRCAPLALGLVVGLGLGYGYCYPRSCRPRYYCYPRSDYYSDMCYPRPCYPI